MTAVALDIKKDTDGFSVLVKADNFIYALWMDLWFNESNELEVDWNQYIFNTTDSKDQAVEKYQRDCDNFELFSTTAIETLETLNLIPYE